jgi:hypothetical protein
MTFAILSYFFHRKTEIAHFCILFITNWTMLTITVKGDLRQAALLLDEQSFPCTVSIQLMPGCADFEVGFETKTEFEEYAEHFDEMVSHDRRWFSHAKTIPVEDRMNNQEHRRLGQEVLAKSYNLINLFGCDRVDPEVHRRMGTLEELFADRIELRIVKLDSGDGAGVGHEVGAGVIPGVGPGLSGGVGPRVMPGVGPQIAQRLAVVWHGQEPLKLVDPIGQSKWCGLVVSHSCTYRSGHGYHWVGPTVTGSGSGVDLSSLR